MIGYFESTTTPIIYLNIKGVMTKILVYATDIKLIDTLTDIEIDDFKSRVSKFNIIYEGELIQNYDDNIISTMKELGFTFKEVKE